MLLQRIQQNGVDIKQDPITLDGFFSALQIFEALAIDQSLPFDLINALQVADSLICVSIHG